MLVFAVDRSRVGRHCLSVNNLVTRMNISHSKALLTSSGNAATHVEWLIYNALIKIDIAADGTVFVNGDPIYQTVHADNQALSKGNSK
jgi:hypothetical protein